MCDRYAFFPGALNRSLRGIAAAQSAARFPERYNTAPSAMGMPFVRVAGNGNGEAKTGIARGRWGLLASDAQQPHSRAKTHDARIETVAKSKSYRHAFRFNRCLVPAAGWYEFEPLPPEGRRNPRQPWFVRRADEEGIAFAGLWSRWQKGGWVVDSYCLLVRDHTDASGRAHERMPIVVRADEYEAWLDPQRNEPAAIFAVLQRAALDGLVTYRVGESVLDTKIEGSALIRPIDAERSSIA